MYRIPESLLKKMVTKLQQLLHVSCTLHIHAVTLDIVSVSYMENSAYSGKYIFFRFF